jgi:hypothetical protein
VSYLDVSERQRRKPRNAPLEQERVEGCLQIGDAQGLGISVTSMSIGGGRPTPGGLASSLPKMTERDILNTAFLVARWLAFQMRASRLSSHALGFALEGRPAS